MQHCYTSGLRFFILLPKMKLVRSKLFRTRQQPHDTGEYRRSVVLYCGNAQTPLGGVWFFIAATPKHQIVVSNHTKNRDD